MRRTESLFQIIRIINWLCATEENNKLGSRVVVVARCVVCKFWHCRRICYTDRQMDRGRSSGTEWIDGIGRKRGGLAKDSLRMHCAKKLVRWFVAAQEEHDYKTALCWVGGLALHERTDGLDWIWFLRTEHCVENRFIITPRCIGNGHKLEHKFVNLFRTAFDERELLSTSQLPHPSLFVPCHSVPYRPVLCCAVLWQYTPPNHWLSNGSESTLAAIVISIFGSLVANQRD